MYDVKQFVLKHNHIKTLPNRILYLDSETEYTKEGETEKHHAKLIVTCYVNYSHKSKRHRERWLKFTNTYDFNNYLQSLAREKNILWVIGHNIFFDLQASDVFYYLPRWGWTLDFYYDKGLTYILVIHKGKRRIKFVSSTNYFDTSLKALGDMIGLPKLDVDFVDVSDKDLYVYCKRDVEIVKVAIEKYMDFIRQNDLGRFALTRASQAYNAFRHRFMYRKIYIHQDENIKELERAAYFGGRTECFRFGKQPKDKYVTLDINSMYPYIMKNLPLPYRVIDYRENISILELKNILNKYACIAEVKINTDKPAYAVRMRYKTVFPIGEFIATLMQ